MSRIDSAEKDRYLPEVTSLKSFSSSCDWTGKLIPVSTTANLGSEYPLAEFGFHVWSGYKLA